ATSLELLGLGFAGCSADAVGAAVLPVVSLRARTASHFPECSETIRSADLAKRLNHSASGEVGKRPREGENGIEANCRMWLRIIEMHSYAALYCVPILGVILWFIGIWFLGEPYPRLWSAIWPALVFAAVFTLIAEGTKK